MRDSAVRIHERHHSKRNHSESQRDTAVRGTATERENAERDSTVRDNAVTSLARSLSLVVWPSWHLPSPVARRTSA